MIRCFNPDATIPVRLESSGPESPVFMARTLSVRQFQEYIALLEKAEAGIYGSAEQISALGFALTSAIASTSIGGDAKDFAFQELSDALTLPQLFELARGVILANAAGPEIRKKSDSPQS